MANGTQVLLQGRMLTHRYGLFAIYYPLCLKAYIGKQKKWPIYLIAHVDWESIGKACNMNHVSDDILLSNSATASSPAGHSPLSMTHLAPMGAPTASQGLKTKIISSDARTKSAFSRDLGCCLRSANNVSLSTQTLYS
jgi:hypothetical protein